MRVFCLLLFLSISGPAQAETTTRSFLLEYDKATEDGQRFLVSFLGGLLAAYTWANVTLKAESKPPLFCPNAQFGREAEDPIKLLRRIAGGDPAMLEVPVGAAVLTNLKRRFPCRETEE